METDRAIFERLKQTNDIIKKFIDLVPANFYFDEEDKERLKAAEEGSNQKGGKKRGLTSEKAKSKRMKFDPRSVSELQEYLSKEQREENDTKGKARARVENHQSANANLRESLQTKIKELQAERLGMEGNKDTISIKEKIRLTKKEKKMKMKLKKLKSAKSQSATKSGDAAAKKTAQQSAKPVYNKEGKMIFTKFDFSVDSGENKSGETLSGKNYKKILSKVEREKEKIAKMEVDNEEGARKVVERNAWARAEQRAAGVKVKDNPALLRKSLKKQQIRKKKSAKEWAERTKGVQEKIKRKQDKRQANVQKKREGRKEQKISRAKKRGRMIPGF